MLGVELRKSGQYAEALSVFQQMETVKRTASSRKNIQWLEKQLAKPQQGEDVEASGDAANSSEAAKNIIDRMDESGERSSDSLGQIFELMEP
jgi:hypothetical protein